MKNNKKVVAIGGGKIERLETLPIDRRVVALTHKQTPNALFIPTASYDDSDYWKDFQRVYSQTLGCTADVLYLLEDPPSPSKIKEKIKTADLIYVGGGNTLKMMNRWRHLGVTKWIKEAWQNGVVCSGLSAGALCWFLYGHSDSMYYYVPHSDWSYIRVRGLGLFPLTLCPHYDGEQRDASFQKMILNKGNVGVALDNNCAIEILDNRYRILTSTENAKAYKVFKKKGTVYQVEILQSSQFRSIHELLVSHPVFSSVAEPVL